MLAGFLVVGYLSGLDIDLAKTLGFGSEQAGFGIARPSWMPVIEFPWRILFGTVVTFSIAVLFRTSAAKIAEARDAP
jgi:hypothetical protein